MYSELSSPTVPSQTLKQNTPESQPLLEARLPALTAAVCPQCSHVETNVRKQSIFCLVELLLIFGTEKVDSMLEALTVSQVSVQPRPQGGGLGG